MLAQLAESAEQVAEAFARVEQYYKHAMDNVLVVLIVGLAFVGFIIPALMLLLQSQRIKQLKDELTRLLKDEVGEVTKRADAKLEQVAREADSKLKETEANAIRMRTTHSAWHWYALAGVAFETKVWADGLVYWCRAIDYALVAEWPADDPAWNVLKECLPDRAPAEDSRSLRRAVKDHPYIRNALFETIGQLRGIPREKPFSDLLAKLEAVLLDRPMPKPPESG